MRNAMRNYLNALVTAGLLLTSACTSSHNNLLSNHAVPDPTPSSFFTCYGYGCKYKARIALTPADWQEVRAKFDPPPEDAPTERKDVAEAVAQIERFVGHRTGTLVHQKDSRFNMGDPTQLDCVDNSINTFTYITMLTRDGLLHYHTLAGLAHRGTLLTLDFSNTAVLAENGTGNKFAIDPWLGEAGVPPPVFPLAMWYSME
jgi:hypothetical protein